MNMENIDVRENVTSYTDDVTKTVLHPRDVADLQRIVSACAKAQQTLYPYSSGKNWGLGSRLPVEKGAVLLDLHRLNKIIKVDREYGYAIIQAGVTQKQLSDYLLENNIPWKFPVTGSASGTSVVGNMLDRGATLFFCRRNLLLGVEAVLADGTLVKTGQWHFHRSEDTPIFYAPGVGPDLSQLLCQSNMAVVSAVAVKLLPRSRGTILYMECDEAQMPAAVDALKQMQLDGLLDEGVLVTNKNDPRTTERKAFSYTGAWAIFASFSGIAEVLKAKKNEIQDRVKVYCTSPVFIATDGDEPLAHPYLATVRDMYNGIPSNYSLETLAQMYGVDLQDEREIDTNKKIPGMAVALMAVPFKGKDMIAVVQVIREVCEQSGVQAFYNFASLDEHSFEGFFRHYFDQTDQDAVRIAHAWNARVHEELAQKLDIYPYRINIKQMAAFTKAEDDTFWQTVRKIKRALDPHQIISRGRYCPS